MKNKLENPNYKRMYGVLREKTAAYLSMGMCVVLLLTFISAIMSCIGLAPLIAKISEPLYQVLYGRTSVNLTLIEKIDLVFNSSITEFTLLGTFILSFGMLVVFETLIFGTLSYFTKIVLSKVGKLKDMFSYLFKNEMPIWWNCILLAAITIIPFGISFTIAFVLIQINGKPDFTKNYQYYLYLFEVVGIPLLVTFVLRVFFVFSRNLLMINSCGFPKCISKSFKLICGRFFHFIGFEIFINLKNIVISVLCISIIEYLTKDMTILYYMLSFILFLQKYTILVKLFVGIPVYFYSLLSVNRLISKENYETVDIVLNENPSEDKSEVDIVIDSDEKDESSN